VYYRLTVDWIPVVTTLLGTVVGVGSTLVVDRVRSSREQRQRWDDLRRQSYVQFLVATNHTHQALCAVALGISSSEAPKAARAREAFVSNGIYAACEQVVIVAPEPIRIAANVAFDLLKRYRDLIENGHDTDNSANRALLDQYRQSRDSLRELMHEDLRSFGPAGIGS